MPNFLLFLRIFNAVAVGVIFAVVAFFSSIFYLGTPETHQLLRQHLIENFFLRFGAFILFGLGLSILPFLVNLLIVWRTSLPISMAHRVVLKAAGASVVGALGGTALSFSH